MKQLDFTFQSYQDRLTIVATMVVPKEPKGVFQIVHGMSEHRERYLPFMEAMAKRGWLCVIHDHRGHGESIKDAGDHGYFYERGGMYLMEDTHQLTYMMKQNYPDLPYVLFGHSMGSLVVRAYTKKYDYELDALIVCGSPSKNPLAICAQMLASCMARWKGDRYRSSLIQKLAFGSFAKRFPETSENSWICSDEQVVKAYNEDPACGFVFTLNGFENLFRLMRNAYDPDDWKCLHKQLPILFVAGQDDPCIIDQAHFIQAVNFMKKRGYQAVTYRLYPAMRHEILNEKHHDQVYADIIDFVETHTQAHKKEEPKEPVLG